MRYVGVVICAGMLSVGILFLWYGVDGLRYTFTEAPRVDRPGDFAGDGSIIAIGLLLSIFAVRWFWHAVRPVKATGSGPGV